MAAAVLHHDRVVFRNAVKIVDVELPVVLHFRVVEKVPFDPGSGRRLRGLFAQLVNNAVDGDKLDDERIPHDGFVEKHVARRVVVAVDEARHDGHALCVHRTRAFAGESSHLAGRSHRDEFSIAYRESLGAW